MSDDHNGSSNSKGEKLLYCSFCGKSQHEVRKLIAGPSVFVCDECVELCNDIIREEVQEDSDSARTKDKFPKPLEIYQILDEYVMLFKRDIREILQIPELEFTRVLGENINPMIQVAGNMGFGRGWRYK